MKTNEILDLIIRTANVENLLIESPYDSIKRQLRYYREDIPRKPRYLFDADAVYFYNCDDLISAERNKKNHQKLAECGDIMTSLWAPLTYYLQLNTSRIVPKNNKSIDLILKSAGEKRTKEAFELLNNLSMNYVSRGNLLLLPNTKNQNNKRNLNPDKFRLSEDKIDQFLYLCLEGELKDYFHGKTEYVIEWIKSERLECLFSPTFFSSSINDCDNHSDEIVISVENLQSLIGTPNRIKTYKYLDLNENEWNMYFERLNKVIAYRNTVKFDSHLPFCWT